MMARSGPQYALTPTEVARIQYLYRYEGVTTLALSERFGVSRGVIARAIHGMRGKRLVYDEAETTKGEEP
jgi:hypothetical protein